MYELGIVGGMGPEATAEIFRRIIAFTAASCDQEHISMCILNKPRIASRTDYVLSGGENPLQTISQSIDELVMLGVRNFIIPCNTSHVFSEAFSRRSEIAFVDMIKATMNHVRKRFANRRTCILATQATAALNLYGDTETGEGPSVFYPDQKSQEELMDIISSIKGKAEPLRESRSRLIRVMKKLWKNEIDCIFIIACTELSVAMAGFTARGIHYVDALDVLAVTAIEKCGYKVDERTLSAYMRETP